MSKPSKKRLRTAVEDVADADYAKPAVKKSKLDGTGKAGVTKKSSKAKEPKNEPLVEEPASKKEKKTKKEKKRKSKDVEALPDADEESAPAPAPAMSSDNNKSEGAGNGDVSTADKKSSKTKKKEKKDKKEKKKKDKSNTASITSTAAAEDEADQQQQQQNGEEEDPSAESTKASRFIVFVGNLPFSATADDVRAHFATLHPTSVRLLTQRDDPRKSRGIAFVEFGRYDHMKTCLEKFHHTEFGEGAAARKINVELTAGGGGKTAHRQDKIKQKNAKLNEERAQRMKKEGEAKQAKTQEQRDEEAIHPSRRGRVPYGKQ